MEMNSQIQQWHQEWQKDNCLASEIKNYQRTAEILKSMLRHYHKELEERENNVAEKIETDILKETIKNIKIALSAVEKQIPKKPVHYLKYIVPRCPCCKIRLGSYQGEEVIKFTDVLVCDCGQRIDWSESEENRNEEN